MNIPFERTLYAGWGDIDFNDHMFNAAYLAKSVDTRMMFFTENGFGSDVLSELGVGPVVMKDELRYFSEFRMMEPVVVRLELAGMSDDGSRFRVRNDLCKANGALAARVTSDAGWLDLKARKLVLPPEGLHKLMLSLSRTEDFEVLRSSIRDRR